jgi:hypothetical protein
VTDTPNAPTPTTPATAEQLREDAARLRKSVDDIERTLDHGLTPDGDEFDPDTLVDIYALRDASTRAAAALDAEAARMEAGDKVDNAMEALDELHRQAQNADGSVGALVTMSSYYAIVASALTNRGKAPHAELRGWGVMRPDGTLLPFIADNGEDASESRRYVEHHIETFGSIRQRHRAVPVRLTTEGATDAK